MQNNNKKVTVKNLEKYWNSKNEIKQNGIRTQKNMNFKLIFEI